MNSYVVMRKGHAVRGAKAFVAVDDKDGKTVLGFDSLSPVSIEYVRTLEIVKLQGVMVCRASVGQLAVSREVQGRGLAGQSLLAAGPRCLRAASGRGVMLLIDAKDENVAAWYARYGAVPLHNATLTSVLPLAAIAAALKKTGANLDSFCEIRLRFGDPRHFSVK